MRLDLHHNILAVSALGNTAIGTNTVTNGGIIDTKGYYALEFVLTSGALTDGNFVGSLEEGHTANLSDATPVAAENILGAFPSFGAADDNVLQQVGVRLGNKRYVRLKVTSTGVTTGGSLSAIALLANSQQRPTLED